jgi:hypothetical protein
MSPLSDCCGTGIKGYRIAHRVDRGSSFGAVGAVGFDATIGKSRKRDSRRHDPPARR